MRRKSRRWRRVRASCGRRSGEARGGRRGGTRMARARARVFMYSSARTCPVVTNLQAVTRAVRLVHCLLQHQRFIVVVPRVVRVLTSAPRARRHLRVTARGEVGKSLLISVKSEEGQVKISRPSRRVSARRKNKNKKSATQTYHRRPPECAAPSSLHTPIPRETSAARPARATSSFRAEVRPQATPDARHSRRP